MPTLKSRVTCYTLKKKHVFWKPAALRFCWIIPNYCLQINVNTKPSKTSSVFYFSVGKTHCCIAGNPTALLHGLRSSQPQHVFQVILKSRHTIVRYILIVITTVNICFSNKYYCKLLITYLILDIMVPTLIIFF